MSGVNKAILLGYLGGDPEMRYSGNGTAITNFSIATSEKWKDKGGEAQEKTEWHKIVAFGKLAEICGEYLTKGKQVFIEGRLQTRSWEDKEGNKRYTTEIVASSIQMLGASGSVGGGSKQKPASSGDGGSFRDDDIPF